MNELVSILKQSNFQISGLLVKNYKKLNITDIEFIVILYLLNESYNPKEIANNLDLKLPEILEIINNLSEKGILKVELKKINNITVEEISFDGMYEKLSLLIMGKQDKKDSTNIYDKFEVELGRTLSPMEYEIINGWLQSSSEETLILALKEAIYNGVTNFRYIDRIVNEWSKKGIKTKEDVEKNKRQFKQPKKNNIEVFDYDWLNDD